MWVEAQALPSSAKGGGSQGVPRFAKPTEGLSESGGLLGAQLPGSHAVPWQGAGCHLLAGPVPDRHSPMGKGLLRAAPGAAMPVGRGHAGRGWSTELSCALLREVEGAASARLTQNVPLPGAHSTGMEAATPPHTHTRPGFGPISTGLGTIWCTLYLFCRHSGSRAGAHCLQQEVGRSAGPCPCPGCLPLGAARTLSTPSPAELPRAQPPARSGTRAGGRNAWQRRT